MVEATVATAPVTLDVHAPVRPKLDVGFNPARALVFFGVLACALFFVAYSIYSDVSESGVRATSWLPFVAAWRRAVHCARIRVRQRLSRHRERRRDGDLHALAAGASRRGVVGLFNFLGVLASSGAVAYGIIALLPVELILQVGSSAGFAMVFALLIGAIVWNLGTWYLGLPASSSHTLIGSIIGVGLANQMMSARRRQRRRLGAGVEDRLLAAAVAAHRVLRRRAAAAGAEGGRAAAGALSASRKAPRRRRCGFAAC